MLGKAFGGLGGSGDDKNGTPAFQMPTTPGSATSANVLSSQFGVVKEILENGIRKEVCSIGWTEHGADRSIEVSEYITDPKKVDQSFQIGGPPIQNNGNGRNP
jgi:hypothetical protein